MRTLVRGNHILITSPLLYNYLDLLCVKAAFHTAICIHYWVFMSIVLGVFEKIFDVQANTQILIIVTVYINLRIEPNK